MAHRLLVMLLCAMVLTSPSLGASFWYQGPYGAEGSWNVYEVVTTPLSWAAARTDARSREYQGTPGELVDILSAEENRFLEYVRNLSGANNVWLGLTDREGVVPPTMSGGLPAPQESHFLPNPAQQGWAWTSQFPFEYSNWLPGRPFDLNRLEDAVMMTASGRWQDFPSGLPADWPVAPTLQPGTSLNETGSTVNAYIVEYPTESTAPWPDLPAPPTPGRMPSQLPGTPADPGMLAVTTFAGNLPTSYAIGPNVILAEEIAAGRIQAASASIQIPYGASYWLTRGSQATEAELIRMAQPPGPAPPILNTAQGEIWVPESGVYTFQVIGNGNFSLQIDDLPFQSAYGHGQVDPSAPSALFASDRGLEYAARGSIHLEAGSHELRLLSWATLSGMSWEISTAQGEIAHERDAQWLILGSDEEVAPLRRTPPARLVGTATVANLRVEDGGLARSLLEAQEAIEFGRDADLLLVRDDVTTLILRDEDGICCFRPGLAIPASEQFRWPVNELALGGVDVRVDDFSSEVTGQLVVDDGDDVSGERLTLTFGLFGGDSAQFQIVGGSFLATNPGYSPVELENGDFGLGKDLLNSEFAILGLIELEEGRSYDFRVIHYDASADAGLEIWSAWGDQTRSRDLTQFEPLSSTLLQHDLPKNVGIRLQPPDLPRDGDFNRDGVLDLDDLQMLFTALDGRQVLYDLNEDGSISFADVDYWIHQLKGTWFGDANLDGAFNTADLVNIFITGKYESTVTATWQEGDWNGDRHFTSSDFVLALQDGGYESVLGARSLHPVPEPVCFPLLGWLIAIRAATRARSRMRGVTPS